MRKIDKEKAGETALYAVETFQKMVLGFIPGGHLADGFLNFRSGLKQARLISFFDSFKVFLEEHAGRELTSSDFNNEDFVDVMDSIVSKVQTTKSEYKLQRFRNIFLKQIITPIENQKVLKMINIIDDLTDIQMVILDSISDIKTFNSQVDFTKRLDFYNRPKGHTPFQTMREGYTSVKIGKDEIKVINKEIDFLVNDLISKGLIDREIKEKHSIGQQYFRDKTGSYSSNGTYPVKTETEVKYILSIFGRDLLNLIRDIENNTNESQ